MDDENNFSAGSKNSIALLAGDNFAVQIREDRRRDALNSFWVAVISQDAISSFGLELDWFATIGAGEPDSIKHSHVDSFWTGSTRLAHVEGGLFGLGFVFWLE